MAPGQLSAPTLEVGSKGMVTLSIMLATMMQALDTTIANVALPSMQGSLGAAQDSITWVLTSYVVAAAIATPLTGWLTDRLGRKNLFMLSIAGFTVSSMMCGAAQSLDEMVIFRLFQGLFGASLVPLSQSVLLDVNPRERHGQAMAMWGAGIMVAPIMGPTLGGWLTDNFDWRWVFYINVPVGTLALAGVALFVPATGTARRPFDFLGFGFLALAVGGLQMMLDRGQSQDWFSSSEIVIEGVAALIGLWLFLVHIFTTDHPFIEPRLFKDRNLAVGVLFIFVIGVLLFATMALLPLLLQRILGYNTMDTGLLLAPRGIGTMATMLVVGRMLRRIDPRLMILVGLIITSFALLQMTWFSPVMDAMPFIVTGVCQGVGMGLLFVPLSTIAFSTLAPNLRTEGAAMFALSRNLGSSIGISVITTILVRMTSVNHAELVTLAGSSNPIASPLFHYGTTTLSVRQFETMLDGLVSKQAAMIAFIDDFHLMMWMTLMAIPLLLLMSRPKTGETSQQPIVMDE